MQIKNKFECILEKNKSKDLKSVLYFFAYETGGEKEIVWK